MARQNKDKFKIKVAKDGPYLISGYLPLAKEKIVSNKQGESVAWQKIKDYPLKENYALCRCGHSADKPYCDGAHLKSKFIGTETANKQKYNECAGTLEGPELDLKDWPELCALARFCDRVGGTWELITKSDDAAFKKIAVQQACDCPSGRLVAMDKKTSKDIEPDFEPSASLVEDSAAQASGPIWVKGGVQIEAADGFLYEKRNRVTLCRCGQSKNKPYCDGTHIETGFKD
jgi:CDGSH-type Zn-finger protein